MSRYTNYSSLVDLQEGSYKLRLIDELSWEIGHVNSGLFITVPAGYIFDVSIPWWARPVFSPLDRRFFKAAALHDYMLEQGYSRTSSAGVFNEALEADDVSRLRRLFMYLAVSLKGWW
jgi:hypothetical protein